MLKLISGITIRILSNSSLNVFQKILTNSGEYPAVVNFYTYLGLTILCLPFFTTLNYSPEILGNAILMGILGSLGNYFIIKALSMGELSTLAPINSYKPVVALLAGIFLLHEIPTLKDCFGILFIITGSLYIVNSAFLFSKACLYRFLALFFSATEAIFIKKIIILSNITSAFFYWAAAGFIFAAIIAFKHSYKICVQNIKPQIFLIITTALMQYSTNYVFSKMNVAYALALFQLSTLVSVFFGVKLFDEKNLKRKILCSIIMIAGALLLILR